MANECRRADRFERQFAFAEKYRPQIAKVAGCSPESHWGDIETVLSAKVRQLSQASAGGG